jgi:hypothetical protein
MFWAPRGCPLWFCFPHSDIEAQTRGGYERQMGDSAPEPVFLWSLPAAGYNAGTLHKPSRKRITGRHNLGICFFRTPR